MNIMLLKEIEFDLAYLGLLTQAGLKPLSRWEKPLGESDLDAIEHIGLHTGYVQRKLLNGKTTTEFIFSLSEVNLDMYMARFDGKPIEKSVNEQRLEGFFFGFPPCCVENFAHHGYQPNSLATADQEILFHWSCPNCQLTPLLVPEYRKLYRLCKDVFSDKIIEWDFDKKPVNKWLKQGVALAASLALVATGVGFHLPGKASALPVFDDDPHLLPLSNGDADQDNDYLYDYEENRLGMSPDKPDTDGDGRLDGVQLAYELFALYETLLHANHADQSYVVDHRFRGIEHCAVCDTSVNMGYVEIINPLENLSIEVPYIGLHYLQHGSFNFSGDVHGTNRVNPSLLKVVLESDGSAHISEMYNDLDKDGIPDQDEPFLGMDSTKADSDGNGVIDGVQLARELAAKIDDLPRHECKDSVYVVEWLAKGIEACEVCGMSVNMGYMEIINPMANLRYNINFIAHHFMQCGGFQYEGEANVGLVNIRLLKTVLEADGSAHRLTIEGDTDSDGLQDNLESRFNCKIKNPDSDGNGVPDGVQLSQTLWSEIEALPRDVKENQAYRLDFAMNGLETCNVCGIMVNMGYIEIHNPLEDFSIELPYIALHFMQHGSFAYDGDVHNTGQVDPRQPDFAVNSEGTMHILTVDGDSDKDGLKDAEESHFDTEKLNPDSDSDGVLDGAELAKGYAAAIDSLPREPQADGLFVKEYLMWGLEHCAICGDTPNMGYFEIINPTTNDSLQIPFVALHYMQHGSFAYNGNVHGEGRVDPIELADWFGDTPTSTESHDENIPTSFALHPSFPNPFAVNDYGKGSGTLIQYQVGRDNSVQVDINIYNVLGQKVRTLVSQKRPAGQNQTMWDGRDDLGEIVPAGVYFYRMRAGEFTQTRKMILIH